MKENTFRSIRTNQARTTFTTNIHDFFLGDTSEMKSCFREPENR